MEGATASGSRRDIAPATMLILTQKFAGRPSQKAPQLAQCHQQKEIFSSEPFAAETDLLLTSSQQCDGLRFDRQRKSIASPPIFDRTRVGRLAQLVRASLLQSEGQGFESLAAHSSFFSALATLATPMSNNRSQLLARFETAQPTNSGASSSGCRSAAVTDSYPLEQDPASRNVDGQTSSVG